MKSITPSRKTKKRFLSVLALGAITHGAFAQSGTWISEIDGLWSNSANWLNGIIADGAGNTATFDNPSASAVQVELDSSRTLGNLTFVNGTYTITNITGNVLTLAGPQKPVINVMGGQVATLRGLVLAGSDGFVVEGGGTLALFKENTDPANTITGGVVLNNGTLAAQGINADDNNIANTLALGTIDSVTFQNGTLNLRPAPNTGVSFGTFNASLHVPADGTGTLILPVRWSGSTGDNGAAGPGLGGALTGSGTFNVETKYFRNNVVGDWSAFSGVLNITANPTGDGNEFRYANVLGFPNARVSMGGGTPFTFRYYPAMPTSTNFPIGRLTGDNADVFLSGSPNAATTLTYEIGALQTDPSDLDTFLGGIVNAAGPAGLIKRGAGTLVIAGASTYTGPTIVSNGVLQIGDSFNDAGTIGSGPVTNLGALVFARPAGTLLVTAPIHGPGAITNMGFGGTLVLAGSNTYSAPTVVTAGKLIVGTASRATGAYILSDAAEGFGVLASGANQQLIISSLSYGLPSTFEVDFASTGNPAAPLVNNTGNLAMNGDVIVNIRGNNITTGSITLMQWASRSGSGNFVLGSLPPHVTGADLNTVGNTLVLTVNSTFDSTLRWVGDASGIWDSGNTANQVWREVGSGILTNYYEGARVRFDDSASGISTVTISGVVAPQSVIVSNATKNYAFIGGPITGGATLTKLGSGTLTMAVANDYSGETRIDGGTLRIGDGTTDGALGTGVVTNNATLEFNLIGGPVSVANQIHGTGRVIQAGTGQVNLSGNNTFSGGVVIRSGAIFGNNNVNAAGIGGGILIEGGTVLLGAHINNNVGTAVILTNATFQNPSGGNFNVDIPLQGTNVGILFDKSGLLTLNRTLANLSGVVTNRGGGGLRFNSGGGNNATGSDNIRWIMEPDSGWLQPRNAGVNFLGSLEGFGTISAQHSGGGTVTWVIGGMNTSTTYEGTISDGASFNQGARFTALTKAGTGTLTLNNAILTYRGATTVSNGVLALSGVSSPEHTSGFTVLAPGTLDVTGRTDGTLTLGTGTTNQILRGSGTIQGNVVLGSNSGLQPGGAAAGEAANLAVSGSVTLAGNHVFEVSTSGSPASDRLTASTIVYGGTLLITNIGNITGTNVFTLFSGNRSGTFANVITPTIPGVTFDTANLNVNGTITVSGPAGVSNSPTNIITSVSGGVLTLSWPSSHQGWRLQAQTNSLSVGLSNNWVDVTGSTDTNRVDIPISTGSEAVFFRLVLP